MTYVELFSIMSKPWANVNDIKSIAYCGRDEATYIRNNITKEIKESGKHIPTTKEKIVPMEYVIKYLGLNIDHITDMARKEKSI